MLQHSNPSSDTVTSNRNSVPCISLPAFGRGIIALSNIVVLLALPGLVPTQSTAIAAAITINPADSYVHDQNAETNFGTSTNLYVGDENHNDPIATTRTYLKFDLSSIPEGATINSATLYLFAWGTGPDPDIVVEAHYLEDDTSWQPNTITWNNAPQDFVPAPSATHTFDSNGWASWNVTTDVQHAWGDDRVVSIVMKEPTPSEGVDHNWVGMNSVENTTSNPYLEIDYNVVPVPSLTEWGLVAFVLLLGATGVIILGKRRHITG